MATRRNKSRLATAKSEQRLTPIQEALLKEADRKFKVSVDGQQLEESADALLARKLMQMALSGSPHAMSNALFELHMAQSLKLAKVEKDVRVGNLLKTQQQEKFDRAIKAGEDPDTVLPHPDDIIVVEGEGYRVIGPWCEPALQLFKKNCARRDVFILQQALEDRLGVAEPSATHDRSVRFGQNGAGSGSTPLLFVYRMNAGLPDRLAMSDTDIAVTLMRHKAKTKRQLLKATYSAWRAIGEPKPRGWTSPPIDYARRSMEWTIPALHSLYQELVAGKIVDEYAIAKRLREISVSPKLS